MFERLGSWTYRFRFLILIAWIAGAAFFAIAAPSLSGQGSTDQTSFLPANAPSRIAKDAIERAFPGSTSTSSATITMDRPGGLTDADREWRDAFAAWAESEEAPERLRAAVTDTETADSRPELKDLFRADDGTFELFVVNLNVTDAGDDAKAVVEELRAHVRESAPQGLEAHVTGAAAISSDYLEAVQVGTDSTTTVTIILVILVLLAIYRAPLAALIPLATIGAAFAVSKGVLGFLASAGWQVSSTLETFLVVMVFGVGTDYAIFLISRYREEVSHDGDWHDAAKITVRRIGAVITASAGTVIVGMMAMGVGDFKMITSMGPGIAIAVAVTLFAALTLSPALLSIFGHYLFWPLHTRERYEGEPRGFFAGLARVVSRRPVVTTIGLTALLMVPILYLPQVKSNFDVLADLPKTADSSIGYRQIGDHLGEDKLVQSTALIDLGGDGDILAPAQLAKLHAVMEALHAGGGIATTTSIVTPGGDTVVPDGFRPSRTLQEMADGFKGDTGSSSEADNASLLDPEVKDGLNQALDYVNGLAVDFPDVAAGVQWREARDGLEHAIDVVDRVGKQSVVSTQLRTLSASITDPGNAAAAGTGSDDEAQSTLMSDYLAELAAAFPEVTTLDAYSKAVKAAGALEKKASITDALNLSAAFDELADHFDALPDATLSPESLAGTASAKEFKKEAEDTFNALPDQFAALAAVYSTRPDDLYLPANLTGDDAGKLHDAIDAFMSKDHTATRFYLTSSNAPYSGGAFQIIKDARGILEEGAATFGTSASGHIGGPTAQFTDVEDTLASDFVKVGAITVLGILIVLMLLLRAVVAPLYLVATVLVSYGSTLGVSGFLFQEVLGHQGVSPYLPLIVFVLLVALGSDYNIFLMHRIREEAETAGMKDAVRKASGHTGAVITSAGLILAGTFGSMATAPLTILFQVGVAVAIGVLIDTFLVRSILVPAITTIVGDWAWWPSGFRFGGGAAPVPVPVPVLVAASSTVPAAVVDGGLVPTAPPRGTYRRRLAVALAIVIMVPLVVAGLLTWSLGGAMDNVGSLRAAVVNLDEGGTMTGPDGTVTDLRLGDDLTVTLVKPGDGEGFEWVTASKTDADAGLADGTYAAVLTIPGEFSRTVAGIRSDRTGTAPQAKLEIVTDDGAGYALGPVARSVAAAIATSTAQGVTASYVDDVLLAVTGAHATVTRAAGAAGDLSGSSSHLANNASGVSAVAGQLVDGLQQLVDGTSGTSQITELVDGTQAIADATSKVAAGQKALAKGTRAAASGADQLADGAVEVANGAAALDASTAALPAQVDQLAEGATELAAGAAQVAGGWTLFTNGNPSTNPPTPGLKDLASSTNGMGAGARQLDDAAGQLLTTATKANNDALKAANKAGASAQAAGTVASDAGALAAAVAALAGQCDGLYTASDPICQGLAGLQANAGDLANAAAGSAQDAGASAQAAGDVVVDTATVEGYAQGVKHGTADLATQLPQLEQGIDDLHAGAGQLLTGTDDLASGLDTYAKGMQQLAAGVPQLADGVSQLSAGTAGVASGAKDLADGLDELAKGATALAAGASKTAAGAQALADGTASATGGMDELTRAAALALDAGALVEAQSGDLAESGTTISDDAQALADDLESSAAGIGNYGTETRIRLGALAADPVAVEATAANSVRGSQDGLAPFLMALAAWLGAMGAFLVLPAIWASDRRRGVRGVLVAFGLAALVGVAGSLLMVAGMRVLLDLQVADMIRLVGFAVLATLAFTAIVQALVAMFGTRGWLLALLLLVVQVAAVGIPYAESAAPGPIAAINPFLPMTYAVDGLRGAITGGGSHPAVDTLVLSASLVVALMITLAAAAGPAIRRGRTSADAGAVA